MTDGSKNDLVLVTGAGGFIGGHLIGELRRLGYRRLRAVDVKPIDEWYQRFPTSIRSGSISRDRDACHAASRERARSTTSRATWAAWASSRRTRPSA